MIEPEYEIFDKHIYVYKNLITNPEVLVSLLKEAESNPEISQVYSNWSKWSVFGTYMDANYNVDESLVKDKERYNLEKFYRQQILDAFKISTSHFLKEHNLEVGKDWLTMGPSYCRYDQNIVNHPADIFGPLTMTYHTDYRVWEHDSPEPQFALTCTMYLNDDYEGGDVIFKLLNNEERKRYKPKAGDVMVFPSGHPKLLSEDGIYFHGVKEVTKNDKYFIRYFYMLPNEPSKEWLELEKKYGKEEWKKRYYEIVQIRRERGLSHADSQLK